MKKIQKALELKGYTLREFIPKRRDGYRQVYFNSPIELPELTKLQQKHLKSLLVAYWDDRISGYNIENILVCISYLPFLKTYDE